MKIAYLLHLNLGPNSGVFKKIVAQSNLWKEMGHQIGIFVFTREDDVYKKITAYKGHFDIECEVYENYPKLFPLSRFKAINNVVKKVYRYAPDIVYTRRDLYYPQLRKMAKDFPLVIEVNSNEIIELKHYSLGQYIYHVLTRRLLDNNVAGFVFVTTELASDEYYSKLRARSKVIGNGINLKEFENIPIELCDVPHLIFIGSDYPWVGVDKIFKMAEIFKEWKFILIGNISKIKKKNLDNVIVIHSLSRDEYTRWLKVSDVAIGSLALHRNRMNEGSSLKVREYLAFGLPVISAYKDIDIPNYADYYLRLPNNEDNIVTQADKIRAFVDSWRGKRVERKNVLCLDIYNKEKSRLDFFSDIIDEFKRHHNEK